MQQETLHNTAQVVDVGRQVLEKESILFRRTDFTLLLVKIQIFPAMRAWFFLT